MVFKPSNLTLSQSNVGNPSNPIPEKEISPFSIPKILNSVNFTSLSIQQQIMMYTFGTRSHLQCCPSKILISLLDYKLWSFQLIYSFPHLLFNITRTSSFLTASFSLASSQSHFFSCPIWSPTTVTSFSAEGSGSFTSVSHPRILHKTPCLHESYKATSRPPRFNQEMQIEKPEKSSFSSPLQPNSVKFYL